MNTCVGLTGSLEVSFSICMRGSRRFCQRGCNFDSFFVVFLLVMGGRIQIPL